MIRAPIGLAYYPGTNELLVTMNQRNDLGCSATPGDWLALVLLGKTWKITDCATASRALAAPGVPKPVAVLDKHAAVSGVAIVTGQLGFDGRDRAALVGELDARQGPSGLAEEGRLELHRHDVDLGDGTAEPGSGDPRPWGGRRDGIGDWGTGHRVPRRRNSLTRQKMALIRLPARPASGGR